MGNITTTQNIDYWLTQNLGPGEYREIFDPFVNRPARYFEIYDEESAIIFKLKWA